MSRGDAHWSDRLLAGARAGAEPGSEDAARNLASIEARLGLLDAGSGPGGRTAHGREPSARAPEPVRAPLRELRAPLAAVRHAALVKVGLVLSFGLTTGVVGYWIGRTESPERQDALESVPPRAPAANAPSARTDSVTASSPASAPGDSPAAAIASSEPAAAAPASVPPRAKPRAHIPAARGAARAVAETTPAFTLSDALDRLRHAEGAVRRSDGLEARMWLGDLDRRAPREMLREERLVTQTLAECVLGDTVAAAESLSQLEQTNPESIYRARLEGSCVANRLRER